MNLTAGYPFSLVKYGLPFNYSALSSDLQADVAIIGGGISGALMAHHLLKHGISCVVVDGRTIGLGSTCASTSLLQYEIDVPLCELAKKIGTQEAVSAYKQCEAAIDSLEDIAREINFTGFENKQSLYYAAAKKDISFLKEEFVIRKANEFAVELIDKATLKEHFMIDAPCAILSARAAQTNAYSFTHALLQYNIAKGLKVYDRTKVIKQKHNKENVQLTTEHGVVITAKKVVYANGYEAVNYIEKKIVDLHCTFAVSSEQIENKSLPIAPGTLYWSTGDPYLYIRTTEDNRIIVGGRDEKFYDPEKRDRLLPKKSKQLQNDFDKLFNTSSFKPEFSWAGTFGSTKDGLPFIGAYKKLPNSYFALGFGGNGITFSLIAAEILSKEIKGIDTVPAIFSFDRV